MILTVDGMAKSFNLPLLILKVSNTRRVYGECGGEELERSTDWQCCLPSYVIITELCMCAKVNLIVPVKGGPVKTRPVGPTILILSAFCFLSSGKM